MYRRRGPALDWRRAAFLAAACVLCGAARAAEPPATTEKDFLADVPVVLTASRLGQPASEAPNAITVIDRELIHATGAREIAELLRLVPGMYVSYQTYVFGLQAIVSYHGLTSELTNRMQVLVDGRAVYNPTLGEVSWTNLPLHIDDIERIEVVRGPAAASHGANSFLGVINIITRHAAQDRGVHASLTRGTRSVDDRVLRYGGNAGNFDYRLTAAYRQDDTYPAVADSRRIDLFTFRGDYRLSNVDSLTFQAGYNGGTRQTQAPQSVQPDPVDHPRDIRIGNHFEQIQWVRALDGGNELSLQFYHNFLGQKDVSLTEPIALLGNQQFTVDDSVRAHRYDIELQHTVNAMPGLRWVWGGSSRYDSSEAPTTLRAPVSNHSQRIFGHAEWRPAPRWLLNLGAMVEHTDFTGTDLSPRAAVNYQLAPRHTLRASVSRALRNPSLMEEKADRRYVFGPLLVQRYLVSGNLQPESIVSRDVGYIAELPMGLNFDARVFNDRLTRLVGEIVVPFPAAYNGITRDFINANEVHQTGFETQLRWRVNRSTRVGLSQAHINTQSNNATADFTHSTPRNLYSFFGVKEFGGGLSGTLLLFQQDPAHPLLFGEQQERIKRVDARLAQRFRLGASRAEASLAVQDLFNGKHTDFRHDNMFDRRAYATLEVAF